MHHKYYNLITLSALVLLVSGKYRCCFYLHVICRSKEKVLFHHTPCILMFLRKKRTLSFAALDRADHEATPTPTQGPSLTAERSLPLPATTTALEVYIGPDILAVIGIHGSLYRCYRLRTVDYSWTYVYMDIKRESDVWRFPMEPLVFSV